MTETVQSPTTPSLRQQQHSLICRLADRIEHLWNQYLELSPYEMPEDLGYVEGRLEGERVTIENHCYQTPQFRKLHLELAKVGPSLDILHCVMFPRSRYALPMFGNDLVGSSKAGISAAIVDLSPINAQGKLPEIYDRQLSALPQTEFSQRRELPAWGEIFSPHCLFVRPMDEAEELNFLAKVEAYLTIHCQNAALAEPVQTAEEEAELLAAQRYYCAKQRENDKTKRVLEKAFGDEWADRYMKTMLFDTL
jgi:phycocyanobilin:ferredoxin oxidoreductase